MHTARPPYAAAPQRLWGLPSEGCVRVTGKYVSGLRMPDTVNMAIRGKGAYCPTTHRVTAHSREKTNIYISSLLRSVLF